MPLFRYMYIAMIHRLSVLKVRTYTIYSDESWSRNCHVAKSYSLSELLIYTTCTKNSDEVGECCIASISINSHEVTKGLAPETILMT